MSDNGLKITVEDSKYVQASAFVQSSMFQEFNFKEEDAVFKCNLGVMLVRFFNEYFVQLFLKFPLYCANESLGATAPPNFLCPHSNASHFIHDDCVTANDNLIYNQNNLNLFRNVLTFLGVEKIQAHTQL